jgi:protein-tyrosine phosphatase
LPDTRVIQADSAAGDWLGEALRVLREGGLVAFPTETVYGVGASAADAGAFERLRRLKDRPKQPFSVHMGRPADAFRYVAEPPTRATHLIRKAWPGPLTLLLPVGRRLADPALDDRDLHRRLTADGIIGLRCPDHPAAAALLGGIDGPVVASSANRAGRKPPSSAEEVLAELGGRIDLLVDGGRAELAKASTIVAFDGEQARVVREGDLDARQIERLARWSVLFVCTGNTCRSPMAAGLGRKLLAERYGRRPDRLGEAGVEVRSAGVATLGGGPASAEAVAAAGGRGADIRDHVTRALSSELIHAADLVLCMGRSHVEQARSLAPEAAGKIHLLCPDGEVQDPIGRDLAAYERSAERIESCLRRRMEENLL